jgi:hypothetical protein
MIVSEAKTNLKAYGFDDTDPLLTWLQAAKEEIFGSDNWPFLLKVGTVAVNANVQTIGVLLPADIEKISTIRNASTTRSPKLTYVDPVAFDRDFEDFSEQGDPQYYTVRTLAIAPFLEVQVWPVPTTAWTMRVFYQATTSDITGLIDAASLPGPTSFHFPIVQKAAGIALQVDNEEDRSTTAHNAADTAIARLRRKYLSNLDEGDTVEDVMGYT